MKFRSSCLYIPAMLVFLCCGLWAAEDAERNFFNLPAFKIAPTIDGKIFEGEWTQAISFGGFKIKLPDGKFILSDIDTRVFAGFDDKRIYFAWQCPLTETPGLSQNKVRDRGLWTEESFEVYLYPSNDAKHVFQFIGNPSGEIYDSEDGNKAWDGRWEYKTSLCDKYWQGELAIDFSQLSSNSPKNGDKWGINFCRNIQRPLEQNVSWADGYDNWGNMIFDRFAPSIQIDPLGKVIAGENPVNVQIKNNASRPQQYLLSAGRGTTGSQQLAGAYGRTNVLPPHSAGEIQTRYYPKHVGPFELELSIKNYPAGKTWFFQKLPLMANAPLCVKVMPSFVKQYCDVEIDATNMKTPLPAALKIEMYADKNPSPVFEKNLSTVDSMQEIRIPIPAHARQCRIITSAVTASGIAIANDTQMLDIMPKPLWVGSKLGTEDVLPAPWTPVEVKVDTVKCILREYKFDATPFPCSIISAGDELLAAPIRLCGNTDGKPLKFQDEKVKLQSEGDTKAVVTADAESQGLSLKSKTTVEYDGTMLIDITLTPAKPLQMEGLTLEIPLRYENAKYLHHPNGILHESGSDIVGPDGWRWQKPFYPVLWFGGDNRGLCWFSDSDEGWRPYDRKNIVDVTRQGNKVICRINILGTCVLKEPLHLRMGLQATPVKPMNEKWHNWHIVHCKGGPSGDIGPLDPAYTNEMTGQWTPESLKASGVNTLVLHSYWAKDFSGFEAYRPEEFKKLVRRMHDNGIKVLIYLAPGMLTGQFDSFFEYGKDDWRAFPLGRWGSTTVRKGQWAVTCCSCVPEYRDFMAEGVKKLLTEYDVDGLYYDAGISPCRNFRHGCGYLPASSPKSTSTQRGAGVIGIDYVDAGKDKTAAYRVKYDLLGQRELFKRLYVICKSIKPDSIISHHMSNFMFIPMTSFADIYWNGEQVITYPQGWYPSMEEFRAQFVGRPWGVPAEFLAYQREWPNPWDALSFTLLHDVTVRPAISPWDNNLIGPVSKIWKAMDEFNVANSTWHPYYDNDGCFKISPSDENIKVSFYSHEGKNVLLIVSDISAGETARNISIEFDPVKLGLPAKELQAVDVLENKPCTLAGKALQIPLEHRKPRMILLHPKP